MLLTCCAALEEEESKLTDLNSKLETGIAENESKTKAAEQEAASAAATIKQMEKEIERLLRRARLPASSCKGKPPTATDGHRWWHRNRISGNGNQAAAPSRHLSCAARSRAFLGANPAYVCAALGSPSTPQRARAMHVSDRLEGH